MYSMYVLAALNSINYITLFMPGSFVLRVDTRSVSSWTVQYTPRKTEASTLRCTENPHTQINNFSSTLTTHWKTSWGLTEPETKMF